MSRSWPVYSLRVPEELHDQVRKSAKKNKRSINSEYLYRIEHSLDQDELLKKLLEEVQQLRGDFKTFRNS